jgi:hypothetical protein
LCAAAFVAEHPAIGEAAKIVASDFQGALAAAAVIVKFPGIPGSPYYWWIRIDIGSFLFARKQKGKGMNRAWLPSGPLDYFQRFEVPSRCQYGALALRPGVFTLKATKPLPFWSDGHF